MRTLTQRGFICLAITASVVCLGALSASSVASAQTTDSNSYTLLAPLPCVQVTSSNGATYGCPNGVGTLQNVKTVTFSTYIQFALNLFIALAAVAAVVMIVWGGLEYMMSAIPTVKTNGLDRVKNAVVGLIMVLASFIILRTIDPRLVDIPSTLVPQLKNLNTTSTLYGISTDTSGNFFQKLGNDAVGYSAAQGQIGSLMLQAKDKVTSLQDDLDGLLQQESEYVANQTPKDDPDYMKLEAQITQQQQAIHAAEIDVAIKVAQTEMAASMNLGNSGQGVENGQAKTYQDVKDAEANLAKAEQNAIYNLSDLGDLSDTDVQTIENSYSAANGHLLLQEAILSGMPTYGIQEVNNKVVPLLNRITDPGAVSQLKADVNSTMVLLCPGDPKNPSCKTTPFIK